MAEQIAVIVKGYPRLSETFIAQEILALERRGLALTIVSLRHPTDPARHDLHEHISACVHYLPEYLHDEPGRVISALFFWVRRPRFRPALRLYLSDLLRDPTRNRIRRFGQALVLARELPEAIELLYVHYLHTPASVARYASSLRSLPYAISAHAKDIWITPDWEKRRKIEEARWLVTCSRYNIDHLRPLSGATPVSCLYHGIDLNLFTDPDRATGSDGSDAEHPVTLISIARAVDKKGLDIWIRAMARLSPRLAWRGVHIGGGPHLQWLKKLAQRCGIADRMSWRGSLDRRAVLGELRAAEIFCLPARIGKDGDRDGLPNVLLEALSQKVAVVATDVGAIPELIEHERTGLLIPVDDLSACERALSRLITDPALRLELGTGGRRKVERSFAFGAGIDRLAELLRGGCTNEPLAA